MSIVSKIVGIVSPPAGAALAVLGKVPSAIGGALDWLAKNPLAAVCLGLAVFGGVQHHQAAHWRTIAAQRATALAAIPAAQDQALAQQRALDGYVADQYQAQAEKADAHYKLALADAGPAADRYIATHRLRPSVAADRAGSPGAAAQTGDPGLSAALPGDGVVVSAGDVQACTGATAYAVSDHNAAVDAVAAGLAEFSLEPGAR